MTRDFTDVLHLLLNAAWRRRYIICIPILLLPMLAAIASFYVPKSYSTRMSILVQEPAALNPFLEEFALSPKLKERIKPLQALLKSEHVLVDVLEDLGEIDGNTTPLKRALAIEKLANSVNSELVGSEVIKLTLKDSTAEGMARKLNAISSRFVERIVAPGRSSVEGSEKFLRQQMLDRQQKLQKAETRLSAFKFENAGTLPEIYATNVKRLATLQDTYDSKLIELAAAKRGYQDLRKRLSGTNPLIGQLEEQIVSLSSELVSFKSRYTPSHSKVKDVEAKLSRLRAERSELLSVSIEVSDEELNRLFNIAMGQSGSFDENGQSPFLVSQMLRLQDAQSKKVSLEKEVEQMRIKIIQLNRSIARFGPIERKMQGLERNIRVAQGLYEKLAERYEMARVTGALGRFEAPERVKIVDAPTDPLWPDTPGLFIFLIGGLIGGTMLGLSLATITELLDQTVHSAHELSENLGLPILSRISLIGAIHAPAAYGPSSSSSFHQDMGSSKTHASSNPSNPVLIPLIKASKVIAKNALPLMRDVVVQIWRWIPPLLSSLFIFACLKLGIKHRP